MPALWAAVSIVELEPTATTPMFVMAAALLLFLAGGVVIGVAGYVIGAVGYGMARRRAAAS